MTLTKQGVVRAYKSFCVRTQGFSHIVKDIPCEDYALTYSTADCSIIVVCDGHGGDDYIRSRFGSEFAAEAVKACIADFVANVDNKKFREEGIKKRDEIFRQLESSIISSWDDKISEHFRNNPFTEDELSGISDKARSRYEEGRIHSAYGTTLLAVVMTERYWFALQIGDCRCVVLESENFEQPVPWNDKCLFNETTSICDSNAIQEFTNYYSEDLPDAIFIASDGVEDSFASEDKMYAFYRLIHQSLTDDTKEWDDSVKELQDYIPLLSERGSHDDVSIAGLVKVTPVERKIQSEEGLRDDNDSLIDQCSSRWQR